MVERVRKFASEILHRHGKIYKGSKIGLWYYCIHVKQLLPTFKSLDIQFGDPPKPPPWCMEKDQFFGAYLAGVIDGDGDITISRPKYPKCKIRITSGSPSVKLSKSIEDLLGCSTSIIKQEGMKTWKDRTFKSTCYRLEFYVSRKTLDFIKDYILPQLTITHKIEKLQKFVKFKESLLQKVSG